MIDTPRRPVMRYHGGKWKLAPWIISHLPPHKVYVEPFGGAASVLMRKARAYAEIYNDLTGDVVNVFRVLRDPLQSAELERVIRLTPFARDEFLLTGMEEMDALADPIERARRTIARSFMGFGSAASNPVHSTGFRSNSNRSNTTPAHDWANYPDHIATFTRRLHAVVIENRPAIDVILHHDGPSTLHFVDPPYLFSTRRLDRSKGKGTYVHEMTDDDHRELAGVLRHLIGMVVVCGYPSPLYEELFAGWHRAEIASHADGARDRTEVLWLSPNIEQQPRLAIAGVN